MTNEELQAIRERLGKATAGPWKNHDQEINALHGLGIAYVFVSKEACPRDPEEAIGNAQFIAHAREDVEKLLYRCEMLQRIIISHECPKNDRYKLDHKIVERVQKEMKGTDLGR